MLSLSCRPTQVSPCWGSATSSMPSSSPSTHVAESSIFKGNLNRLASGIATSTRHPDTDPNAVTSAIRTWWRIHWRQLAFAALLVYVSSPDIHIHGQLGRNDEVIVRAPDGPDSSYVRAGNAARPALTQSVRHPAHFHMGAALSRPRVRLFSVLLGDRSEFLGFEQCDSDFDCEWSLPERSPRAPGDSDRGGGRYVPPARR